MAITKYAKLEDFWRTIIIPVQKNGDKYTITVVRELWNDLQIMILEGAKKDMSNIEFKINDELSPQKEGKDEI